MELLNDDLEAFRMRWLKECDFVRSGSWMNEPFFEICDKASRMFSFVKTSKIPDSRVTAFSRHSQDLSLIHI